MMMDECFEFSLEEFVCDCVMKVLCVLYMVLKQMHLLLKISVSRCHFEMYVWLVE